MQCTDRCILFDVHCGSIKSGDVGNKSSGESGINGKSGFFAQCCRNAPFQVGIHESLSAELCLEHFCLELHGVPLPV